MLLPTIFANPAFTVKTFDAFATDDVIRRVIQNAGTFTETQMRIVKVHIGTPFPPHFQALAGMVALTTKNATRKEKRPREAFMSIQIPIADILDINLLYCGIQLDLSLLLAPQSL